MVRGWARPDRPWRSSPNGCLALVRFARYAIRVLAASGQDSAGAASDGWKRRSRSGTAKRPPRCTSFEQSGRRRRDPSCGGDQCAWLRASTEAGRLIPFSGELERLMAGLACREPSLLARQEPEWAAVAFIAIPDEAAVDAMRLLAPDGIVSGKTGRAASARDAGDWPGPPPPAFSTERAAACLPEPAAHWLVADSADLAITSAGSICCGVFWPFPAALCAMLREFVEEPT